MQENISLLVQREHAHYGARKHGHPDARNYAYPGAREHKCACFHTGTKKHVR